MFDDQVNGAPAAMPTAAVTLSLVSAAHRDIVEQECRLVELAAHWCDLHHPDSRAPAERTLPGAEQGRQLGGEGTPEVLESLLPSWLLGWKPATGQPGLRWRMHLICGTGTLSYGNS
jgi:hypothetical protein